MNMLQSTGVILIQLGVSVWKNTTLILQLQIILLIVSFIIFFLFADGRCATFHSLKVYLASFMCEDAQILFMFSKKKKLFRKLIKNLP
jgi:hypothetical protein